MRLNHASLKSRPQSSSTIVQHKSWETGGLVAFEDVSLQWFVETHDDSHNLNGLFVHTLKPTQSLSLSQRNSFVAKWFANVPFKNFFFKVYNDICKNQRKYCPEIWESARESTDLCPQINKDYPFY